MEHHPTNDPTQPLTMANADYKQFLQEEYGIDIQTIKGAVRDLGMDPEGNEPIDEKLRAAAADNTLIKFADGVFYIEDRTILEGYIDLALLGEGPGPVASGTRFVFGRNGTHRLIIREGDGLLFGNIGIGQGADGACPGLWLSAEDRLTIKRVRFHGRGIDAKSGFESYPNETDALSVGVTDPDGRGVVRDYECINGGQMRNHHEGNGRIGIWALNDHKGTLKFKNIDVEECPNNGMYTSSCPGKIQVEDSVLKNNGVSQIRLSTLGSYIEASEIGYDADESNARDPMTPGHGTQGIAFDSGKYDDGAVARGCHIAMGRLAAGRGGIAVWSRSGHHVVHDCEITISDDAQSSGKALPGLNCEIPSTSHDDTDVLMTGTTINGSAASGAAIRAIGRRVRLRDACIRQPNGGRDGVLVNTGLVDVEGCRATVGGELVRAKHGGELIGSFSETQWCPNRNAGQGWVRTDGGTTDMTDAGDGSADDR